MFFSPAKIVFFSWEIAVFDDFRTFIPWGDQFGLFIFYSVNRIYTSVFFIRKKIQSERISASQLADKGLLGDAPLKERLRLATLLSNTCATDAEAWMGGGEVTQALIYALATTDDPGVMRFVCTHEHMASALAPLVRRAWLFYERIRFHEIQAGRLKAVIDGFYQKSSASTCPWEKRGKTLDSRRVKNIGLLHAFHEKKISRYEEKFATENVAFDPRAIGESFLGEIFDDAVGPSRDFGKDVSSGEILAWSDFFFDGDSGQSSRGGIGAPGKVPFHPNTSTAEYPLKNRHQSSKFKRITRLDYP